MNQQQTVLRGRTFVCMLLTAAAMIAALRTVPAAEEKLMDYEERTVEVVADG